MIKTEHASLQSRKKGIEWETLPKTFQDAIVLVRHLGLRYLWIDSLCIIQDDKADWEKESATMASIYTNSILTIAATKSAGSDGGCFSHVPNNGRTHKIMGLDKDGVNFVVYVRPQVSNWEKSPLPLYSRAWCFQERILSPRILHFEHNELKWECNAIIARESELVSTSRRTEKTNGLGNESDPHSMNDVWRKTVREYVGLDITYESDRLPALSGLAKHIQQTYTRGRYLAGLWEDSLLEDLMWWVREEDTHKTSRPKQWRAPSWTWASLEGSIQHRILPIKTAHCTIVGVHVVNAGVDSTGAVSSGSITLLGTLVSATLRTIRPGSVPDSYAPNQWRFGIDFDGIQNAKPHKMYADYEFENDQVRPLPDGHEIFGFCIAADQWHKCWLVLRKGSSTLVEIYERIGMAWQSHAQVKDGEDWEALATDDTSVTIL